MNLIEFFGTVIKPKQTKGKGLWCPCETGIIFETLFAIRDKDVNVYLIKSKTGYIAIDSGYKNSNNVRKALEMLKIQASEIKAVFLTHLDLDHAGGLDSRCESIFPQSKIYLGKEEEKYLTGEFYRKKILGIGLSSPIKLHNAYETLEDNQNISIDGVEIRAIFTFGHTMGHTAYLVDDKFLFSGDVLLLGDDGGYGFLDFWNVDSVENRKSVEKMYTLANEKNVKLIATSHSGICSDIEFAFRHRNQNPNWKKKGFVFRKDAPKNPYVS